jgi:hypothetical protein
MAPFADIVEYYKQRYIESEAARKKSVKERNAIMKLLPNSASTGRPSQMTLRSQRAKILEDRIEQLELQLVSQPESRWMKLFNQEAQMNAKLETEKKEFSEALSKYYEELAIKETNLKSEIEHWKCKYDTLKSKYSAKMTEWCARKKSYKSSVVDLQQQLDDSINVNFAANAAMEGLKYDV